MMMMMIGAVVPVVVVVVVTIITTNITIIIIIVMIRSSQDQLLMPTFVGPYDIGNGCSPKGLIPKNIWFVRQQSNQPNAYPLTGCRHNGVIGHEQ